MPLREAAEGARSKRSEWNRNTPVAPLNSATGQSASELILYVLTSELRLVRYIRVVPLVGETANGT